MGNSVPEHVHSAGQLQRFQQYSIEGYLSVSGRTRNTRALCQHPRVRAEDYHYIVNELNL